MPTSEHGEGSFASSPCTPLAVAVAAWPLHSLVPRVHAFAEFTLQ